MSEADKKEDCKKCNQTVQNCECHIPYEEKHSGLIKFCKMVVDGEFKLTTKKKGK